MIKEAYDLGLAQAYAQYGITKLAGIDMAGKMLTMVPKAEQFAAGGFRAASGRMTNSVGRMGGMLGAGGTRRVPGMARAAAPAAAPTFGQRASKFWNESTGGQQLAMGAGAAYAGNRLLNGNQ